eukprot:CAMPEP_0181297124 /NCGR_PEP_ID=MMETSP1101-20121128/5069_1 /TAXON_ID=46948 /ORGANISM="Rhodomonas abbreviata, Strain Caron Lab Isolate" /LENGTH=410 /DNA_ID=CAMNT_0023402033 /DNA_START=159 /DNA_END=1391 /DNA_ORIENTATION=-
MNPEALATPAPAQGICSAGPAQPKYSADFEEELRTLGWIYDHDDADRPLRKYNAADGTMGEKASLENLPQESDEYFTLKQVVHRYVMRVVTEHYGFETVRLPLDKDLPPDHDPRVRTSIWLSPNALQKKHLLILAPGKCENRSPTWNIRGCIYDGLRIGTMETYFEKARERDWGLVILNPNNNGVVLDSDPERIQDEQDGPAPPHLVKGIEEFGFAEAAAHRACLTTQTLELERCGNWISNYLKRPDIILQDLSEQERRSRVHLIPMSEDPVVHMRYVWDNLIEPSEAKTVSFLAFSFGGFSVLRLLEARFEQMAKKVPAIAMADSSHFIDCTGQPDANVQDFLSSRVKNWICSSSPINHDLQQQRLHVPCVSSSTPTHGLVAGVIVDSAVAFLDSMMLPVAAGVGKGEA